MQDLEAFFAVCQTLSFSKAGQLLHLSQPAISRQIRLLEEHYGQQLFFRDKHRVALTPQGEKFKTRMYPPFQAFKAAAREMRGEVDEMRGPIRIGCLREAGPFVELCLAFQKKFPKTTFQFEFMDNFESTNALKNALVDYAIVTRMPNLHNIRSYPLYNQKSVVATSAKNSKEFADFKRGETIPFVRYLLQTQLNSDRHSHFRAIIDKYAKDFRGKKFEAVFAVNSHRSMVEVLLASPGTYAVMPAYFIRKFVSYGKLRRVGEYQLQSKIYLAVTENPYREARFNAFQRFVIEECRKLQ